ncbi:unnamed protein product [Lactuca saligna]|uniref:Uncharacterized protein n=1 Tax=Lactuca saligna TaxID=75948 RepID=A0AA35W117_LACSI|nr:unnamed protein product [Lactuca saligna]
MYSVATSKTVRSRVIVGVAPSFKSAQRDYQWKEFCTMLEQKHHALKVEKMEYEARTKVCRETMHILVFQTSTSTENMIRAGYNNHHCRSSYISFMESAFKEGKRWTNGASKQVPSGSCKLVCTSQETLHFNAEILSNNNILYFISRLAGIPPYVYK